MEFEVIFCPYCSTLAEEFDFSEITERTRYRCTNDNSCGEEFEIIRLNAIRDE